MSYKVLYRKYRPDSFDNVVGQDYTVSMLKNVISTGKNAHAYIFTGPRGTGKTSSAKIFAKALNCSNPIDGSPCNECASCLSFKESPDIIEIDAASNNGVEEIRELINNVKLVPSNSKFKVYIIDEVHMLTESAFNALLLTLEEPPSHVVFILATTDIQDVPITILSRCQRFDFKPISRDVITKRLAYVCNEENIKVSEDALSEIALISAGGMRDALGMLDQLSSNDQEITLDVVSNYFGSVSGKVIQELLTAIDTHDTDKMLEIYSGIKESGTNYSVFVEKLISELRKLCIDLKLGKSLYSLSFTSIYNMIFDLNECLCNININIDPYILIEIVLLKYVNDKGNSINNFPGNDNRVIDSNTKVKDLNVKNDVKSNENNNKNVKIDTKSVKKVKVINNIPFDINIRINNSFVECSKKIKKDMSDSWSEFVDSLFTLDKNLMSLLLDVEVLVASNSYCLISSKIDSTNDLINNSIFDLEKYYYDFSGKNVKFAALNANLWEKEKEKYMLNLENKIQYSYMEENIVVPDNYKSLDIDSNLSEDVGKNIFGTIEIEK